MKLSPGCSDGAPPSKTTEFRGFGFCFGTFAHICKWRRTKQICLTLSSKSSEKCKIFSILVAVSHRKKGILKTVTAIPSETTATKSLFCCDNILFIPPSRFAHDFVHYFPYFFLNVTCDLFLNHPNRLCED